MIYEIFHSPNKANIDSIHLEWIKPQQYHVDEEYSYRYVVNGRPMPESIKLPLLKLVKGASLEDFISEGSLDNSFSIFSEELILKLSKLKLAQHSLIKLQNFDYYAFHFDENLVDEIVDWEQTSFYIKTKREINKTKVYSFENHENFTKNRRKLTDSSVGNSSFSINKIRIFPIDYDLFYSSSPFYGKYCSQKFVDMVEENGFTGFRFVPVEEDDKFSFA